jgi:DNA-binding response OmpR family regulator
MRVLVVEDDDLVREMAVAALRDAGFEVTQAGLRDAPRDDALPVAVRLPDLFDGTQDSGPQPGADPAAGPLQATSPLQLEASDPLRVLVVENNEPLREPIAEGLRQAGFEVVEACDGEEAMSHCDRPFDVLFTDIDLPGGMDGWTIAERWRETDPAIGVIYTSGFCLEQGRQVGGSRCIPKPYRPGHIVAAVVELANERSSRQTSVERNGAQIPASGAHMIVSQQ